MKRSFDERIGVFNRQTKAIDAIFHNVSNSFSLTDSEFWIMYAVSMHGDITQYDICSNWFYTKQTVNSAIIHLKKQGLVELKPVHDARNRKIIALTGKGKAIVDGAIDKIKEVEQDAFNVLTEDEKNSLVQIFGKYLQAFDTGLKNI